MARSIFHYSSLVRGINLRLRYRYFYFDLVMMGNQFPIIVFSLFYGLIALILKYLVPYPFNFFRYPMLLMHMYYAVLFGHDYVTNVLLKSEEKIPDSNEALNPIEIMLGKRKSIRSYQKRFLTEDHERYVMSVLSDVDYPDDIKFHYLKRNLNTILVTDCLQYIIVTMPINYNNEHLVAIGKALQKVMLLLTREGISTCWVGGFRAEEVINEIKDFDPKKDHVSVTAAFGYESKYKPLVVKWQNKLSRTRIPSSNLFFESRWGKAIDLFSNKDDQWRKVFECTRWSPSAVNEQTTRIVKSTEQEGKYHFFKEGESAYYSILGVGISMTNWESACQELEIDGHFVKEQQDPPEGMKIPKNVVYITTWVCE